MLPFARENDVEALADVFPTEESEIRTVLKAVSKWSENSALADGLGSLGHRLAARCGRFAEAIRVFDILIEVPDPTDAMNYQNALWTALADNNKLPPEPKRLRRVLEASLPHAAKNPAIFFNAACARMELGEPDLAIEHVAQAVAHGFPDLELIRKEPVLAPIARDPRFVALFPQRPTTRRKAAKRRARPRRR